MSSLKLIGTFFKASVQQEMAYRANFFIRTLSTLLRFLSGLAGIWVVFGQTDQIHGWDINSAMALYGIYLLLMGLWELVIQPSLDSLSGMDGEVWTGNFDFTILKPVDKLFYVSIRKWRIFALFDLLLAFGVLGYSIYKMGYTIGWMEGITFLIALIGGLLALYSIMLLLTSLVLFKPTFLFTWIFGYMIQLGRFPVTLYPGWLQLILTWVFPVAVMTTIPAEALRGNVSLPQVILTLFGSIILTVVSAVVFYEGLKKYSSASS